MPPGTPRRRYEGNVDLDKVDPQDRAAFESQILFFGQTPAQLLTRPHPKRRPRAAVGAPRQMFERPEAVRAHGPYWVGGRRGGFGMGPDPVEFIASGPLEDRLLTITRSGKLHIHRWFPLKPNGTGRPFTFTPSSTPLCTLAEASSASRINASVLHPGGVGRGGAASAAALAAATAASPAEAAATSAVDTSLVGPSYAVSADGRWLLSGGHWDGSLRCTCLASPELTVHAQHHAGVVTCVSVGADGATVVTGSADCTLVVWSLYRAQNGASSSAGTPHASPCPVAVLSAHRGPVLCARLSTQMDLVLSGAAPNAAPNAPPTDGGGAAASGGGRLCALWCPSSGHFVRWLPLHGTLPRALAISHTGSGLLVATDRAADFGPGGASANGHLDDAVLLGSSADAAPPLLASARSASSGSLDGAPQQVSPVLSLPWPPLLRFPWPPSSPSLGLPPHPPVAPLVAAARALLDQRPPDVPRAAARADRPPALYARRRDGHRLRGRRRHRPPHA